MKFYSEVTEEMYDTLEALEAAEAADAEKVARLAQEDEVKTAAKKILDEGLRLAQKVVEIEELKFNYRKEEKAFDALQKDFIDNYGIEAYITYILIPAGEKAGVEVVKKTIPVEKVEKIEKTKNDFEDVLRKFLGK